MSAPLPIGPHAPAVCGPALGLRGRCGTMREMRLHWYDDDALAAGQAAPAVFLAGPTRRALDGVPRLTPWRTRAVELFRSAGFDGTLVIPEFRERALAEAVEARFGGAPTSVPGMKATSCGVLRTLVEIISPPSTPMHPGWLRCSSVTYHRVCSLLAPCQPGASAPIPGDIISTSVLTWETAGIEHASVVLFWMPFSLGDDDASLPGFTTRAEVSRELARDPSRVVLGMPEGSLSSSHIRFHAHTAGLVVYPTLEDTVASTLRLLTGLVAGS